MFSVHTYLVRQRATTAKSGSSFEAYPRSPSGRLERAYMDGIGVLWGGFCTKKKKSPALPGVGREKRGR
jgi:hypothetical protein